MLYNSIINEGCMLEMHLRLKTIPNKYSRFTMLWNISIYIFAKSCCFHFFPLWKKYPSKYPFICASAVCVFHLQCRAVLLLSEREVERAWEDRLFALRLGLHSHGYPCTTGRRGGFPQCHVWEAPGSRYDQSCFAVIWLTTLWKLNPWKELDVWFLSGY